MSIFRKKILTICLLVLVIFFISSPVQAYVLQGPHIIDLMIEQLGEAKSLYVTQGVIFYRLVSQTDIDTDETKEEYQALDNAGTDLPADQGAQLDETVASEEMLQLEETLRCFFPLAFRSDAKSSESERIHVVSGDRSITIVDGGIVPTVANRFDLYKDIFLYRTREDLSERLLQLGVDVSISSLGRFEGEISLVLGAVYPDE